jgi:hypothetical protein
VGQLGLAYLKETMDIVQGCEIFWALSGWRREGLGHKIQDQLCVAVSSRIRRQNLPTTSRQHGNDCTTALDHMLTIFCSPTTVIFDCGQPGSSSASYRGADVNISSSSSANTSNTASC